MGALARLRTATWFASERSSNVPAEEGSRVPADSITIEAPPRADSSANGHGSAERARKKRMLIVVNPYATTVSDRLKNLVVYALQGRYDVEAVSTEAQHHAIEIGREAREGGYDVVVAFGGDGTLNEVANGLAGTDVPVSVLPGGSTNVVCRTLGTSCEAPNTLRLGQLHLVGRRPRHLEPLSLARDRHAGVMNVDKPPRPVDLAVNLSLPTMRSYRAAVRSQLGGKVPVELSPSGFAIAGDGDVLHA